MRFTHYASVLAVGALACGVTACSGDDSVNPDDGGADQSALDGSLESGTDSGKDAGKDSTVLDAQPDVAKDTGSDATDGSVDSATDGGASDGGDGGLPASGSPCNTPNVIQQQDCGLCGFQKRACLPGGDGGYVWGDWGFCQNQVVNGCDPKLAYPDTACGNCGTKKTVCLNNCNYDQSQTCNEPPNACAPGSENYVAGLSCDAGGRIQVCSNQCQYGQFGACTTLDGSINNGVVTAAQFVNGTISGTFTLPANTKIGRMGTGSCPSSTISSTLTSYTYIEVKNPHATKTMKVSLWTSKTVNGPTNFDNVMTAYQGNTIPTTDPQRKACSVYVNDTCSDTTGVPASCQGDWAGLMKGSTQNITIPPQSSILVYVAAYNNGDSGDFVFSVRTDVFQ